MGTLSVELFGRKLRNPVMNASGTLGYGKEIEALWGVETLGAYVTKGLSRRPHQGNPTPRVWDERQGMINSIGLQNVGVDRFFDEYFPLFEKRKTPVIVNFFGFTEEEYLDCAAAIPESPWILALEMNLSCPNIKKGGIGFGKDPRMVRDMVRAVKGLAKAPVIAKLTAEVKSLVDVAMAAHEAGADGLTIINTLPAAAVDTGRGWIPIKGGLSGPALRPVALRAVHDVSKSVPIPVIGVGGIMDGQDALAFFMAGARAIQVGTATFVEPYAIPEIIQSLGRHFRRPGAPSLADTIGRARG